MVINKLEYSEKLTNPVEDDNYKVKRIHEKLKQSDPDQEQGLLHDEL